MVILNLSGNLRVRLLNSLNPQDRTYLFALTGNQGNLWKRASVDIGELNAGYKVRMLSKLMSHP